MQQLQNKCTKRTLHWCLRNNINVRIENKTKICLFYWWLLLKIKQALFLSFCIHKSTVSITVIEDTVGPQRTSEYWNNRSVSTVHSSEKKPILTFGGVNIVWLYIFPYNRFLPQFCYIQIFIYTVRLYILHPMSSYFT